MTELGERQVYDTRHVVILVSGAPPVYTPGGRTPINPIRVEFDFRLDTGARGYVFLAGRRLSDDGIVERPMAKWEYGRRPVRFDTVWQSNAPQWLIDLVETYRPEAWLRAAIEASRP